MSPSTIELKFSWTHQQMANAIGSARITVNRLLNQFKAEGWLHNQYRRWFIQRSRLKVLQ
ncbi:MAG: helix-turn-helix domain-containing protein [Prochlorotrichaceae cyanobacterium]